MHRCRSAAVARHRVPAKEQDFPSLALRGYFGENGDLRQFGFFKTP
jgi:hypothetical protein